MTKAAEDFPILGKSPIVEATFQMNFATDSMFSAANAPDFMRDVFPSYKLGGEGFADSISVRKKTPKDPPDEIRHQQKWTMSRFVRGNRVITLFADGFAYGVLKPYPTDGSFFAEILGIERAFEGKCAGMIVTRMGLRFVNSFVVGLGSIRRPSDILRTLPQEPLNVGDVATAHFLYQDRFLRNETGVSVVVNRVYPANGAETPLVPKVVLDIDAAVTPNKPVDAKTFEGILGELRNEADRVFFGSVRESVVEGCR